MPEIEVRTPDGYSKRVDVDQVPEIGDDVFLTPTQPRQVVGRRVQPDGHTIVVIDARFYVPEDAERQGFSSD